MFEAECYYNLHWYKQAFERALVAEKFVNLQVYILFIKNKFL